LPPPRLLASRTRTEEHRLQRNVSCVSDAVSRRRLNKSFSSSLLNWLTYVLQTRISEDELARNDRSNAGVAHLFLVVHNVGETLLAQLSLDDLLFDAPRAHKPEKTCKVRIKC